MVRYLVALSYATPMYRGVKSVMVECQEIKDMQGLSILRNCAINELCNCINDQVLESELLSFSVMPI